MNSNSKSIQTFGAAIIEAQRNNSLNPIQPIGTSVIEALKKNTSKLNKLHETLAPSLRLISSKRFKAFLEHAIKVIIPSFIKRDWYLSSRFLDEADLESLYYQEATKNLDTIITSKFPSYISVTKKLCIKQFPLRKKIINEIFYCYNKKQYSAVITLIYSTVEGIIDENFNQSFWGSGRDSKKNFERLRDDFKVTGVMNIFYKRFSYSGEINKNSKELDKTKEINSNNRHFVLHGHSYTYGTKKNAIKAILMLDFISEFVFWEKVWKNHM